MLTHYVQVCHLLVVMSVESNKSRIQLMYTKAFHTMLSFLSGLNIAGLTSMTQCGLICHVIINWQKKLFTRWLLCVDVLVCIINYHLLYIGVLLQASSFHQT